MASRTKCPWNPTRLLTALAGLLLLMVLSAGCSGRFYGGTKLPPDRLIRLDGNSELHEVRINNSPSRFLQPQHWILLPGEHVVSAKFASARGWGGDKPTVMEFIGKPGHRYALRVDIKGAPATDNGPPGVLRHPSRLVKWELWVEDLDTHERLEEE